MWNISSQRSFKASPEGVNGCGSTGRVRLNPSGIRTWKSTTCAFSFGRPDVPYMKLVLTCRSFCKVSMSISLMTSCSSIVKRGRSFTGYRLCSLYQPRYQGRSYNRSEGRKGSCTGRLLASVQIQPRCSCRNKSVHTRQQGSYRRLQGIHDERSSLQLSYAC